MRQRLSFLLLSVTVSLVLATACAEAPQSAAPTHEPDANELKPGDRPPADIQAKLEAVVPEFEAALAAKNEEAVYAAVEKVRERLRRSTAALDAAGIPYAVIGGNAVAAS